MTTSIAMAVAATAAALVPLSPAHAAYGADQPVYLQLVSNDGYATQLALLDGTVAFDDGNTKYRYSLRLCWQHAYPQPYFTINVNGTSTASPTQTGPTSMSGCQQAYLYSGEVNFGGTVRNVRFDVTGGWFGSNGQYQMRTKSTYTYDNPYN
ncbi:hypothetical protein [Microbispora rosea]|uniref:Uncharacterized protein n=1 Tax=Microbispora rosea TaxID=58117 RepID=A0A1N6URN8_9ACTN|nr:hypothetical protein [Microbispora rosea]GIH46638.1 hypothetical protein Mro03_18170 [Microbispora rosea subsp. rosea]SIQ68303.1 hypothetical protein SAMN05421833_103132 [Microbispora rosea]